MTSPTLLYSGFDMLDAAFTGCLPPQVLIDLSAAKDRAQLDNTPNFIELGPGNVPIQVLESGRRGGYAFQVRTGPDGAIYAFKDSQNANEWNIFANVGSAMLLQHGYAGAKEQLLSDLTGFGAILGTESINRVDYCFDFLMKDFNLKPEQMIAPPNSTKGAYLEGRAVDDKSMFAFRGRKLETLTVGKMPNLQVQIYDKRREIISKKKSFWADVWNLDLADKTKQVWRIEVRAGKNHLKDRWGLHTFQDIENSFGDVVNLALEKTRYLDDNQDFETVNVTRARLHPIWDAVQKEARVILLEQTSGLCPGAIKEVYREQMVEDTERALAAYARRYAVSKGMSETEIKETLSIEVGSIINSYIENDPEEFLYRTNLTKQKTRLIER